MSREREKYYFRKGGIVFGLKYRPPCVFYLLNHVAEHASPRFGLVGIKVRSPGVQLSHPSVAQVWPRWVPDIDILTGWDTDSLHILISRTEHKFTFGCSLLIKYLRYIPSVDWNKAHELWSQIYLTLNTALFCFQHCVLFIIVSFVAKESMTVWMFSTHVLVL